MNKLQIPLDARNQYGWFIKDNIEEYKERKSIEDLLQSLGFN